MGDSKLEKMVKDVSRHFALRKGTSAQCKLFLFFEAIFIIVLQVQ